MLLFAIDNKEYFFVLHRSMTLLDNMRQKENVPKLVSGTSARKGMGVQVPLRANITPYYVWSYSILGLVKKLKNCAPFSKGTFYYIRHENNHKILGLLYQPEPV